MSADADEQLRQTVSELAAGEGCSWAGIYFVEESNLVLGPEAGTPDPERRTTVPVIWRDTRVAELAVDGDIEPADRRAHRRPLPRRLGHRRRGVAKLTIPSLVRVSGAAPALACPSNGVTHGW
jgi:hypothetical protein